MMARRVVITIVVLFAAFAIGLRGAKAGETAPGCSEGPFDITTSAEQNGFISPPDALVERGKSQTFTMNPAPGYCVSDVQVDGFSKGPVKSYTFRNVQEPHSISASFLECAGRESP